MKLSIITINRNNAEGLKKTLDSVANQTCKDFEHIIIDGASTDGSVEVIKNYENSVHNPSPATHHQIKWISEPDKGIYNAMNKGIRMAEGEYIQILNSGDCLAAVDVIEKSLFLLNKAKGIGVLLGVIVNVWNDGRNMINKPCRAAKNDDLTIVYPSLMDFYRGTIPHDAACIRKDLFERYGFYDEKMKICSDWKFFLQAMVLGTKRKLSDGKSEYVAPLNDGEVMFANLEMVLFDMSGVSNQNTEKWQAEKRPVLEANVPSNILRDYDLYFDDVMLMKRIHKHHFYGLVRFMERVLFKLEKWHIIES